MHLTRTDLENIDRIKRLNSYYKLEKIAQLPYARTRDVPDFKKANNSK